MSSFFSLCYVLAINIEVFLFLYVGLAADQAGLIEGDQLVSVNKQDISTLNHEALVSMIKKVSSE